MLSRLFQISVLSSLLAFAGCSEADRPDTRIKRDPVEKASAEVSFRASISTGFRFYNGSVYFSTLLLEVLNGKPSGSNTRTLENESLKMKLSRPSDKPDTVELEVEISQVSKSTYQLKPFTSEPQAVNISLKKSHLQLLFLADASDSKQIQVFFRSLPLSDGTLNLRNWGLPTLILIEKNETGFRYISFVTANKYQMEPTLALTPPVELAEYNQKQVQPIQGYEQ